jgi:hypothetical protein
MGNAPEARIRVAFDALEATGLRLIADHSSLHTRNV